MSAKKTGRLVLEVPNLDRSVHRRGRKDGSIKVQANDTTAVTCVRGNALPGTPVPHLQTAVHATADQLGIVELKTADARLMASEGLQFLSSIGIPDLDRRIIRPRRQDVVLKVQTHDAIGVSAERVDRAPAVFPVCANLESILVHFFPRPVPGLEVIFSFLRTSW